MDIPKESLHGTFNSYLLGFILSLVLTLIAYFAVAEHLFTEKVLIITIVGLAFTQTVVQLFCFFHLGKETKPRWNLLIFLSMAFVIAIIIGGSLWIMYNLDSRVM